MAGPGAGRWVKASTRDKPSDHISAAGEAPEQILRAHPHLPEGSIQAALAYAAAVVRNELIVPLERRSA